MYRAYAGIGSRETPPSVRHDMTRLARMLAVRGWVLRSGHARGADEAFESGASQGEGWKEIYLPWPHYRHSDSLLYNHKPEALRIAAHFHGAWHRCDYEARLLHARNVPIILGPGLGEDWLLPEDQFLAKAFPPVKFVICWTPEGKTQGGTANGIKIAKDRSIPVFNLATQDFDWSVVKS